MRKKNLWQGYLGQVFGEKAELEINFVARPVQINPELLVGSETSKPSTLDRQATGSATLSKHLDSSNIINRMMAGKRVDVSDQEKWPLANQILAHFPGQVYEVDHE